MKRFEHKTVLITGSSSAIGLAGAERRITEGAKVIVTGRTGQHLKKTLKTFQYETEGFQFFHEPYIVG